MKSNRPTERLQLRGRDIEIEGADDNQVGLLGNKNETRTAAYRCFLSPRRDDDVLDGPWGRLNPRTSLRFS